MSEDRSPRGLFRRVTGEVTGRVVSAVDPDIVLAEIDVDALVARIDPNEVLDRVDVNAVLDRVDVNAVLDRVDPDLLLDRVDPDRLLDRVDVERFLSRVDPQLLLDRVDPDRLLARVDLDALLAGVDLEALVRRSGVPDIVAESTNQIAGRTLDVGRRQLVGLDVIIDKVTDRLLRRDFSTEPAGPQRLVQAGERRGDRHPDRRSVTGHYAGPATRLAAVALDAAAVIGAFTIGVAGIDFLARLFLGYSADRQGFSGFAIAALAAWAWLYWFTTHATAGRSLGKGLVGIRVVADDGSSLTVRKAFWRSLLWPVSGLLAGLGFLMALWHREHNALHDLVAGTTVVYDWGERPVELSGPLTTFLERRA
jgi:uncharacterized RDD family membrane protein YckC